MLNFEKNLTFVAPVLFMDFELGLGLAMTEAGCQSEKCSFDFEVTERKYNPPPTLTKAVVVAPGSRKYSRAFYKLHYAHKQGWLNW